VLTFDYLSRTMHTTELRDMRDIISFGIRSELLRASVAYSAMCNEADGKICCNHLFSQTKRTTLVTVLISATNQPL